ncbi:hypothetical protein QN277_015709 [Acacia crassicarpa]|uniref:Uncharacterized protein n=1 Tax=Acacia crassicarpa TaxID=499986 RepID=A0AAE1JWF4_9FABA|nr:hypothetical protein QN277_015709 [Acacia crassicarpa]
MVSNKDLKKKREDLHEKLQLLRSITHSHSLDKTSIILDATKYIEELKEKVERLNQDIATAEETSKDQNHLPMEEEGGDSMDAEAVTQAVRRVIKNWRESTSQQ